MHLSLLATTLLQVVQIQLVNATNSVALGRDNKITGNDTIVIGGGNGTVAGG